MSVCDASSFNFAGFAQFISVFRQAWAQGVYDGWLDSKIIYKWQMPIDLNAPLFIQRKYFIKLHAAVQVQSWRMVNYNMRPSKINNMLLVRTFWKVGEGCPCYLLFSNCLLFFSRWPPCLKVRIRWPPYRIWRWFYEYALCILKLCPKITNNQNRGGRGRATCYLFYLA